MLKLAVFNSTKYSFNMKTWVSDRARSSLTYNREHYLSGEYECASGNGNKQ